MLKRFNNVLKHVRYSILFILLNVLDAIVITQHINAVVLQLGIPAMFIVFDCLLHVYQLVSCCCARFTNQNIALKSAEWTVVGFVLLKL